jgi:Leukotriene A4 hydrolase, C-terminal
MQADPPIVVQIAVGDTAVHEQTVAFLREQGRMKYLRPLYKALAASGAQGATLAKVSREEPDRKRPAQDAVAAIVAAADAASRHTHNVGDFGLHGNRLLPCSYASAAKNVTAPAVSCQSERKQTDVGVCALHRTPLRRQGTTYTQSLQRWWLRISGFERSKAARHAACAHAMVTRDEGHKTADRCYRRVPAPQELLHHFCQNRVQRKAPELQPWQMCSLLPVVLHCQAQPYCN